MTIDGFTYVRNGIKMGYPFVNSIKSLLPLVDKLFVAVGDSDDGTKEMIESIKDTKIHIIDTVWHEEKRKNGEIFREQVWPLNKKEHLHKKKKSAKISADATCGWYFFCGVCK